MAVTPLEDWKFQQLLDCAKRCADLIDSDEDEFGSGRIMAPDLLRELCNRLEEYDCAFMAVWDCVPFKSRSK